MKPAWSTAALGDVLTYRKHFITIDDTEVYRRPRVRLHAEGIVLRDEVPGALIKTKSQQLCRSGDFLVAEIDAKVGGFGIVPESLSGSIVSSHYFLFEINPNKLERKFLDFFVRTPRFREQVEAQGSTNYAAIRPADVLAYVIRLPSLVEQQRIVARIEELAAQVETARVLRQQATAAAGSLLRRAIARLLDEANWDVQPLGELLAESPRNGLSPKTETDVGGRPMLRINAVSSSPTRYVDLTATKQVEVTDLEAAPFILRHNDVFIVRYNGDINRVAKPAIYKANGECRVVFPDKLMRLRPDASKMCPDFLVFALSSGSVREQVEHLGKTTAGNIGISGRNAKSFVIPVPPLKDQVRIVATLDALHEKVDALKRFQAAGAAELDGLMPSILDRAFKGEL